MEFFHIQLLFHFYLRYTFMIIWLKKPWNVIFIICWPFLNVSFMLKTFSIVYLLISMFLYFGCFFITIQTFQFYHYDLTQLIKYISVLMHKIIKIIGYQCSTHYNHSIFKTRSICNFLEYWNVITIIRSIIHNSGWFNLLYQSLK